MSRSRLVVVGGSGFIGTHVCRGLLESGTSVVNVDRQPPRPPATASGAHWLEADLLTDVTDLPPGDVVLALGNSDPRAVRPWTLVLDNAIATARLARSLHGRKVKLLSSVEVYGWAAGPLREATLPELPLSPDEIELWCERALEMAREPCPPWRAAPLASELASADPEGRWVYALSKAAQERILESVVPNRDLTILRCANLFGLGQERVIARMARAASSGQPIDVPDGVVRTFSPIRELVEVLCGGVGAGTFNVGSTVIALDDLARRIMRLVGRRVPVNTRAAPDRDSCGEVDASRLARGRRLGVPFDWELSQYVRALLNERYAFHPPLPVVIPPRPERPDRVTERIQQALWTGQLKHGNQWTSALEAEIRRRLDLGGDRHVVLTDSGTAALRLALIATVGIAREGDVAILPTFTFPATGEVLLQLGYRLRYCDINDRAWTLDPYALEGVLDDEPRARVVVPVDTLGNPCDYERILAVCAGRGLPVVADSAAALGSLHQGAPVGLQGTAHSFSMSFAKVVSAGGGGGFAVVPAAATLDSGPNWPRSSLMGELSAICALDQFDVLDRLVARRATVAHIYDQMCDRTPELRCQTVRHGDRHSRVHWMLRIASADRDALAEQLGSLGIQTKTHYTPLIHSVLKPGTHTTPSCRLPVSELIAQEALALPISSEMTAYDAEHVVDAVEAFLRDRGRQLEEHGDRDATPRYRWSTSQLDDLIRDVPADADPTPAPRHQPERAINR